MTREELIQKLIELKAGTKEELEHMTTKNLIITAVNYKLIKL